MSEIFVVIEHRDGEQKEISLEMLGKADALCREHGYSLTSILIGDSVDTISDALTAYSDNVIVVNDSRLKHFNSENYTAVLKDLIKKHQPLLTLIGHTTWGMDLAPELSVKTELPLSTDAVDITIEDSQPKVIRQIYGGKIFTKVAFKNADGYIVTVRPGAFPFENTINRNGSLINEPFQGDFPEEKKQFIRYEEAEAADVDITQSDFLLSIGRGVEDEDNIEVIQELADSLGATVACSRPVVDKEWLPKYHQVGTSGKSVKPKVYIAMGISGAFQHLAGITGAETVIAINIDPNAPIFQVADYGVVADLFEITEALMEKTFN